MIRVGEQNKCTWCRSNMICTPSGVLLVGRYHGMQVNAPTTINIACSIHIHTYYIPGTRSQPDPKPKP